MRLCAVAALPLPPDRPSTPLSHHTSAAASQQSADTRPLPARLHHPLERTHTPSHPPLSPPPHPHQTHQALPTRWSPSTSPRWPPTTTGVVSTCCARCVCVGGGGVGGGGTERGGGLALVRGGGGVCVCGGGGGAAGRASLTTRHPPTHPPTPPHPPPPSHPTFTHPHRCCSFQLAVTVGILVAQLINYGVCVSLC